MINACEMAAEENEKEIFKCRANDVISLSFNNNIDDDVKEKWYQPLFTHQIFDDEIIPLSTCDEVKINIKVNTDLSSTVVVSHCSSQDDEDYILHKLKSISPIITDENTGFSEPIGFKLNDFKVGDENFEVYLASCKDKGANTLLQRAEKLAMLYIETADSVDFTDSRWEVIWIYSSSENLTSGGKSSTLAGYMTLFTFHNPFAGSKIRVCQALVLPPYQGRGLGRLALLEVYQLANRRESIMEVTVEDPCEGFQRLRDAVDLEWTLVMKKPLLSDEERKLLSSGDVIDVENLNTLARQLKLVPAQVQYILNTVAYRKLTANDGAIVGTKRPLPDKDISENSLKKFRLRIKKQILKSNGDLLGLSKQRMQRELESMYKEAETRFNNHCCKTYIWK